MRWKAICTMTAVCGLAAAFASEGETAMSDPAALQKRVRELEKENARLAHELSVKMDRYGLYWLDCPEAFDAESENKIPVLSEVAEKEIRNNDGKPTHILIEGDNYHALTCLNFTHRGKIDVIYIDPPYNTEKGDFVYRDKRKLDSFPNGELIKGDSPQRHSVWLSFMSKRLKLARGLLSNKGVVFISIDDNEQANLKLLCDKIFGNNFLGMLILKTATDNNKSQIYTEHEYMLCYCKNKSKQDKWERRSLAAQLIIDKYQELRALDSDVNTIQKELRKWIKGNKENLAHVAHYNNVDEKGVYSSSGNSSNPHPGGYTYDILHPKTHKPVPKPANGWRWPKPTFEEYDRQGEVEWGKDEKTQPHVKKRIETATDSLRSLIYEDNRATTISLSEMFGGEKIFDNPKPTKVLQRIFDLTTDKDSIVLDMFAGSGTSLHAVELLNKQDVGNRQCILVQNAEPTYDIVCGKKQSRKGSKVAFEVGFETIVDITRARSEKVINGYLKQNGETVPGLGGSLKYYRTAFVGKHGCADVLDEDRDELSANAGTMLALAEGALDEVAVPKKAEGFWRHYTDGKHAHTLVYYSSLAKGFPFLSKEADKIREKDPSARLSVYVYTIGGGVDGYENEFDDMRGITLKPIPEPILDIYRVVNGEGR